MLMPPLIAKWNVLKDEDKDLFPLLEVRVEYACPRGWRYQYRVRVRLVALSCWRKLLV